jgi:hypothetical protein
MTMPLTDFVFKKQRLESLVHVPVRRMSLERLGGQRADRSGEVTHEYDLTDAWG